MVFLRFVHQIYSQNQNSHFEPLRSQTYFFSAMSLRTFARYGLFDIKWSVEELAKQAGSALFLFTLLLSFQERFFWSFCRGLSVSTRLTDISGEFENSKVLFLQVAVKFLFFSNRTSKIHFGSIQVVDQNPILCLQLKHIAHQPLLSPSMPQFHCGSYSKGKGAFDIMDIEHIFVSQKPFNTVYLQSWNSPALWHGGNPQACLSWKLQSNISMLCKQLNDSDIENSILPFLQ